MEDFELEAERFRVFANRFLARLKFRGPERVVDTFVACVQTEYHSVYRNAKIGDKINSDARATGFVRACRDFRGVLVDGSTVLTVRPRDADVSYPFDPDHEIHEEALGEDVEFVRMDPNRPVNQNAPIFWLVHRKFPNAAIETIDWPEFDPTVVNRDGKPVLEYVLDRYGSPEIVAALLRRFPDTPATLVQRVGRPFPILGTFSAQQEENFESLRVLLRHGRGFVPDAPTMRSARDSAKNDYVWPASVALMESYYDVPGKARRAVQALASASSRSVPRLGPNSEARRLTEDELRELLKMLTG
jgi:hypothetical protein